MIVIRAWALASLVLFAPAVAAKGMHVWAQDVLAFFAGALR